jgi:hypothetical protein
VAAYLINSPPDSHSRQWRRPGETGEIMGGSGSGWQWGKNLTVEDGLSLSLTALMKKKAVVPGSWTRGSWAWSYEGCEPHARIRHEANLIDPDAAWVRLTYTASGHPMDYPVRLVTTRPTYGGRRWWFLCPLVRKDGGPPRRAAKLYLPPGGRYFGSRDAYGLTYRSCQEVQWTISSARSEHGHGRGVH